MSARRTSKATRLFFALVVLPFFFVFPYLRAVNNPNEFVRVFTCMALVEHGTVAIDEGVLRFGWVNDMARVKGDDGALHYTMVKAPGGTLLGLPAYALFSKVVAPLAGHRYPAVTDSQEARLWWLQMSTWACRLGGVALPCFLFLLWFERYLRAFSEDDVLRLGAVAAVAIGTNYLAYVHMFASHSQYAASLFLAFALVERARRTTREDPSSRRARDAFLAGLFTGGSVLLEYHALFGCIVLSLYALSVFWRPKTLLSFAAGGALNVAVMMLFQWRAYGNPLTPGHKLLETAKFAEEHSQGLWGILWPTWERVGALLFSPAFGLVGMSPYLVLGFLLVPYGLFAPVGGAVRRRHVRVASLVAILVVALLVGVNAGFIEWRAGWTVGPRYLVSAGPYFAFGALVGLEAVATRGRVARSVVRGVSGGLLVASVVSMGLVGLVYDTLPENIARPFAQFSVPLLRLAFVPHHVGEWVGIDGPALFYVCAAAMVLAALVAACARHRERPTHYALRLSLFVVACALGLAPAFSTPEDGTKLFVLHPSVAAFPKIWEPKGRDRLADTRMWAERFGSRRPCVWLRLAAQHRILGDEASAAAATRKAGDVNPSSCPTRWWGL